MFTVSKLSWTKQGIKTGQYELAASRKLQLGKYTHTHQVVMFCQSSSQPASVRLNYETLALQISSNHHTVRNVGYEKGTFVQPEGKLVKWAEKGHYLPFGRN